MFAISSYPVAILLCLMSMLMWGLWASLQKYASRNFSFQNYYWYFALGVIATSLLFAIALGGYGPIGRDFLEDVAQARLGYVGWAVLAGALFNFGNILFQSSVQQGGVVIVMPAGVCLSLVIGMITTYYASPGTADPSFLFLGTSAIVIALVLSAHSHKWLKSEERTLRDRIMGLFTAIIAGIVTGVFYRCLANSMTAAPFAAKGEGVGPYTALVFFGIGLLLSHSLCSSLAHSTRQLGALRLPQAATGNDRYLKLIGLSAGFIFQFALSINLIASGVAGYAIAYGVGFGAVSIASLLGVIIWKEFQHATHEAHYTLIWMFLSYVIGLILIVMSKYV